MTVHMTENYNDIDNEFYVHSGRLAFAICCMKKKVVL